MPTCERCTLPTSGKSKYCVEHKREARKAWLERITIDRERRDNRNIGFQALWDKARDAGLEAAKACVPVPMVVVQHENMMDDNSPVVKSWDVPSGACGFAWVKVRPGNSPFSNWLKKNELGKASSYEGGVTVWCPLPTQSIEIKSAWARAVADVLKAGGVTAYAQDRLD